MPKRANLGSQTASHAYDTTADTAHVCVSKASLNCRTVEAPTVKPHREQVPMHSLMPSRVAM